MASVTVSTLLTRIKDAVDVDNFASDATLLRWLNTVHPRFVRMIARAGWSRLITRESIAANGATEYALTSDIIAVVGVWEQEDTSFRKLDLLDPYEAYPASTGEARAYFVNTVLTGGVQIGLRPIPSSGTYVVDYIKAPDEMVTGAPAAGQINSVNYPAGWEEWLVLEVSRMALMREETVNPALESRMREIEKDVESMVRERAMEGMRIRNTDYYKSDLLDPRNWVWL